MRMRSILLLSLLSLACGLTVLSLLVIHSSLESQIRSNLVADLSHSTITFNNLERQRQQMLDREVALLADLPTIRSLMTTQDPRTIQDGGGEFWHVSGADLFALLSTSGSVVGLYDSTGLPDRADMELQLKHVLDPGNKQHYIFSNHRLYQISFAPLVFGSQESGTPLGFVIAGYAIDDRISREVSQSAAAEVIFLAANEIVSSTLDADHNRNLQQQQPEIEQNTNRDLRLGKEHYIAASVAIPTLSAVPVHLLVLKSYDQASGFADRLNRLLIALGLLVVLVGTVLALYISSTITRPLDTLLAGARALGAGNFDYEFLQGGAKELSELSTAFGHMRDQLRQSQQELVESERLAIIGRMASSISHDLRHYLSAIYANAEFLLHPAIPSDEREGLLDEVKLAVQGMTDVLESLLIFSRTGRSLHPTSESLGLLIERAVGVIRMHPDAQTVAIVVDPFPHTEVWLDSRMMERAVCNLLINAVQAAKTGTPPSEVRVSIRQTAEMLEIRVADSGPGVPPGVRDNLFEPFVSDGKKSGIGLGLTIASRILQEHNGTARLEESRAGRTVFALSLPKRLPETFTPPEVDLSLPHVRS